MTTGKALNGKPYAGNPHVRFDEGEVASAATPRRGSLLYNTRKLMALAAICVAAAMPSWAADMTISTDYVLNDDLTVDGTLTVASGATVDLNGHKLSVKGLAGAGHVTDSQVGNNDYLLLDYIEATGAQRIVTDYVPGANTKIEVVATPTDDSPLTLFGTKSWSNYRFLCMCQNNNWYFFGKAVIVGTFAANTRYRFVVSGGTATLFDDETGAQVGTKSVHMNNNDNTSLAICGITGDTQRGKFKIHSFKVWHENAMRFDFVPARDPATGAVGLLNRLDGTFHVSDESAFLAGSGGGGLHVEAASEAALANFSGTVDPGVLMSLVGDCVLSSDADWRRFPTLCIDGTVDLAGHDLSLSDLRGTGGITDSTNVYERLEYVASTGAQHVKTGIVPSTDTAVEIDLTLTKLEESKAIFGCNWGSRQYLLLSSSSQFRFFGNNETVCGQTVGTRYRISVTPTTSPNGTVTAVDAATGVQLGSKSVNLSNGSNSELALFDQLVPEGRAGAYNLHSFKMWKGGELKRDFIPVHDLNSGKVGLLDNVSGEVFASDTGTDLIAGPVVAKEGRAGHLRIDVSEGRTVKTGSLSLSGSLTLVKEGTGTLVANRTGQTYMGGTHIEGGCVEAMHQAANDPLGRHGGDQIKGSDIIVGSGAVFDFKANFNYRWYNIILDGGTIRNTGSDMAQNSGSLGTVTLTADSTLDFAFNTTVFDLAPIYFDLGGHELTVSALTSGKQLFFRNTGTITNGVFLLKNNTDWRINSALSARGTTLRAEGTLYIGAQLDIDNYYAACTNNVNNGTAAMNVYGRFTPATDYFYGCTLQDGATLDLNGRNGAWATTSAFTSGANHVTFASGATITVDVSTRPTFKGKIVDWGAGNTPSDVTFKLDAASKAMGRALRVKDDGLYAVGGMMIIIR